MSINLSGLSTENAPPAEAPLRLFLVSPIALVLAGILLLGHGDLVLRSRWSSQTLACVHLIVLGSITPVMCGALLQLAPVLMGAPLARPTALATGTGIGLVIGSCAMATGFFWQLDGVLWVGGLLIAMTLIGYSLYLFSALHRARAGQRTAHSIRLAAVSLLLALALGTTLVAARTGWIEVSNYQRLIEIHLMWGIGGWIGLLVLALGMEIIPMFYVAPNYPVVLKTWLPRIGFLGLLLLLLAWWLPADHFRVPLTITVMCVHLTFAGYSLLIEQRRQRPRRDATLWFWQFGHLSVFCAALAWWLSANATVVGLLLLSGALAVVCGSLLKIAPFISWLDLQQAQIAYRRLDVKLPRVRQLLPDRTANQLVGLFLAVVALLLLGSLSRGEFARAGGGALIAFALLFGAALVNLERTRHATRGQLSKATT